MAAKKAKKSTGTRRSNTRLVKKGKGFLRNVLKKLAIIVAVLTAVLWSAAWFFLSDADLKTSNYVYASVMDGTAKAGFRVEDFLVEGIDHTDPDLLLSLVNIGKDDPIFMFNPDNAKEQIRKINWVKDVHVERRLPDTIYIQVIERKPMALWHNGQKLTLIDYEGKEIDNVNLKAFSDLIMVKGAGAPSQVEELVRMLRAEDGIFKKLDHARFVDKRRWDLYLKDKKIVKMPQNDFALALRRLAQKQEKDNILDKDITIIDLRDPERFIVRTELGKVQEYKMSLGEGIPL